MFLLCPATGNHHMSMLKYAKVIALYTYLMLKCDTDIPIITHTQKKGINVSVFIYRVS